jgi:nudix-type nucleoside diphosphatase (YffH/AdpP family)
MPDHILDEEQIFKGKVFDLVRARFRTPNNRVHTFDLVKHHGAVTILPVDQQGNIWFVRQFRVGAGETLLELPAGVLEEGEAPERTAAREIREEIGMAARNIEKLGEFYMVPGYSTEKMHAYLATELFESTLPGDEDEDLERVSIPIEKVYAMIHSGQMLDGKTIATLFLAQPKLQQLFPNTV